MHHANTFLDMVTSPNKISRPTASSLSHTSHPFDQGASPRVPFHNLQLFTSATRLHFENTARCGKKRGKKKKKSRARFRIQTRHVWGKLDRMASNACIANRLAPWQQGQKYRWKQTCRRQWSSVKLRGRKLRILNAWHAKYGRACIKADNKDNGMAENAACETAAENRAAGHPRIDRKR